MGGILAQKSQRVRGSEGQGNDFLELVLWLFDPSDPLTLFSLNPAKIPLFPLDKNLKTWYSTRTINAVPANAEFEDRLATQLNTGRELGSHAL